MAENAADAPDPKIPDEASSGWACGVIGPASFSCACDYPSLVLTLITAYAQTNTLDPPAEDEPAVPNTTCELVNGGAEEAKLQTEKGGQSDAAPVGLVKVG